MKLMITIKSKMRFQIYLDDQDLYTKIQFLNEFINELAYEEFLNEKIAISENSKKLFKKIIE